MSRNGELIACDVPHDDRAVEDVRVLGCAEYIHPIGAAPAGEDEEVSDSHVRVARDHGELGGAALSENTEPRTEHC
jgi:hypothetical protein